jgi:hypothetical protein
MWPSTRSSSKLHPWLRRLNNLAKASAILLLGAVLKPVAERYLAPNSPSLWPLPWPIPGLNIKLLALSGVVYGAANILQLFWFEPIQRNAAVVNATLSHLYATWFEEEPAHRISFLAKRRLGWHLRVFFRFTRNERAEFKSSAHFPEAVSVVGLAWKNPGKPYLIQIPVEPTADCDKFRAYAQARFPLSSRQARQLSDQTCASRWFLCYGVALPAGGTQGVLSIDSPDERSLSKVDQDKLSILGNLLGAVIGASSNT